MDQMAEKRSIAENFILSANEPMISAGVGMKDRTTGGKGGTIIRHQENFVRRTPQSELINTRTTFHTVWTI